MEDKASYQMLLVESKKNRLYTSRSSFIVILFIGVYLFIISQYDANRYIDFKSSHVETVGIHQRVVLQNQKYTHYYSYKDAYGKSHIYKRVERQGGRHWYGNAKRPKYILVDKEIKIFFLPTKPYESHGLHTGGWLAPIHTHYVINRLGLILVIFTPLIILYYFKKIYRFNERIKLGYEYK